MAEKMRIVLLIESVSRANGGMATALDLAETLQSLGHDVRLGIATGHRRYQKEGQQKYPTAIPLANLFTLPGWLERVGAKAKKRRWNLNELVRTVMAGWDDRAAAEILSTADLLVFAISSVSGASMVRLRREAPGKFVRNHAGSPATFISHLHPLVLPKPVDDPKTRYVRFCELFDGLLFQSAAQVEECCQISPDLRPRCFVVPPSCDEAAVDRAGDAESPFLPGRRAIVCVGSIQPRKAQHLALRAFQGVADRFPDAELHFVGGTVDREYEADLRDQAKKEGPAGRVFFHGHRNDHLRFMAHAEVLTQSSEAEGVSRVLREAMYLRLPIVSFALAGTMDLVAAGTEALLVSPGDAEALGESLGKILSEPETARRLALAAHEAYLRRNSRKAYAEAVQGFVSAVRAR